MDDAFVGQLVELTKKWEKQAASVMSYPVEEAILGCVGDLRDLMQSRGVGRWP